MQEPVTLKQPSRSVRSPLEIYAVAVGVTAAAVVLRAVLDPWLGAALPLVTLFGAVAAAEWVGGYRPAIVATVLGYIACDYLFLDPRGRIAVDSPADVIGLITYLFTCSVIIAFGELRRAAQARASDHRELLQVTLSSIGDAVITTDVEGRVTYLNAVAESLTGWTRREAVGLPLTTVFAIVNENTRQTVENPALKTLREGVVVGLANHTVLLRKDGGECPIDDSAAPIRDDRGNVSGCVLIFRDVTAQRLLERDKAQQLLTARLLASIIENSDDAIISKSLEGVIQSWNAAAERLFGHAAEHAIGRHISLIIPPDRIDETNHILASLRAGTRIDHYETERIRSDGRRILVSLTISPIKDDTGRVIGASKIVRDVTVQRQVEQRERVLLAETAAANAKFSVFFDQGALFAAILDLNGTVLETNRFSSEGCGYSTEQIVGKPFWEGPWWAASPRLIEQITTASQQAATGRAFRGEVSYYVADGTQRVADVTIQPIRAETGRVLFLAATGVDITERKRLSDDLRLLATDLSEADRRKNEFLAILAHELRNPLAPISNAARALRLGGRDGEALRAASEMLERQVGQMSRLVDDLLDMSRITQGKIELRKEHLRLAPIVEQAIEAVRPLYKSMNHELTFTLPSRPVHMNADRVRLAQIVGNLLNNACKFTDKGGHVWLTVEPSGNEVEIRVRDNGIGITRENLPRLFDMFAQVDTSLERSRDGLGIGLTLVKTLVELHEGSVTVTSEGLGRGSEFVVRLPVVLDVPEHASAPGTITDVSPVARRVLVVDDSEDGAESLAMLLELAGHTVYKAHDGVEAIEATERLRPDAVLLDIGLPRLNGYEACRRIRQQPWGKDLVMVALTGWGQEDDRNRSREAGFDAHMVKPVDHAALTRLLASLPPRRSAGSEVVS